MSALPEQKVERILVGRARAATRTASSRVRGRSFVLKGETECEGWWEWDESGLPILKHTLTEREEWSVRGGMRRMEPGEG